MGPLNSKLAVQNFIKTLAEIEKQGGKILYGGKKIEGEGNYVQPTVIEIEHDAQMVKKELFAPLVYVMKFKTIEEAI